MYAFLKIMVSAAIIGIVTEIAKRFPAIGGMVAALPLVSLLSIFWLYSQGEKNLELSRFVMGVLWGLPATAFLLFIFYLSLKHSVPFVFSLGLGACGWGLLLFVQNSLMHYIKAHF